MQMTDFSFYFGLGWHHIISWDALDHILFIIALSAIYTLTDWKQVLILVTAFTIGHSITLALSVFDIIRFADQWVEFLIPCTIVFTAISNLFHRNFDKRSVRVNYYLALFFGLIHGMGFANALRFILATDQPLAPALFAFNVGLEAGQLVLVTILLLVAYVMVKKMHINRREWVLFVSASVFALALQMALERFPK
jgi:hypothetical protein